MKKRMNRKGFTLAEVLVVVGIIVVLMGVGAIALLNHMRNMQKLEMDSQAKEIFVAAQNHLSLASSQGYLGITDFGTQDTSDSNVTDVYYCVVNSDKGVSSFPVLNQILPVSSIDESARTGGSYIIRYQKDSGQILDVYYVSTTGRFKLDNDDLLGFSSDDYARLEAARKNTETDFGDYLKNYGKKETKGDAIVGYYGGTAATSLQKGEPLLQPTVRIFNGDVLLAVVDDPNSATANDGSNKLSLLVRGADSGAEKIYDLTANIGETTVILLDNITNANDHFYSLQSASADRFTPGENITVKATAYNNEVLTNIAESDTVTANSLFESRSGKTVTVSSFRHLQNLNKSVSQLGITVDTAVQTKDLDWNEFVGAQFKAELKALTGVDLTAEIVPFTVSQCVTAPASVGTSFTSEGYYLPVYIDDAGHLDYQGNGHFISNVKVSSTAISGTLLAFTDVGAGLFQALPSGSQVSDLELRNFDIVTTANAGALAGSASGTTLSGVLVRNYFTSGNDAALKIEGNNAGGLVGSMTNGSVQYCAAAVYVQGITDAGGLIGRVASTQVSESDTSLVPVRIQNSYSGGHTLDAKYTNVNTEGAEGRVNVISDTGAAGGLIGNASGANLTLNYCYSTCSVVADNTATNAAAGGLIGKGGAGTIGYSYCTGLVAGGKVKGAIVGSGSYTLTTKIVGGKEIKTVLYLAGLPNNASQTGSYTGVSAGDNANYPRFIVVDDTENNVAQAAANTYDPKLKTKYNFPTIQQLHTLYGENWTSLGAFIDSFVTVHYGDWQYPEMEILHYTLTNANTLYTDITLKDTTRLVTVAVYGETSHNATVYLLRLSEDKSTASIVDKGTLESGSSAITWVGEGNIPTTDSLPDVSPIKTSGSDKYLTVTLDNITAEKKHFASVFPNLTPGENITLLVGGGRCGWSELSTLRTKTYEDAPNEGSIIALSDNSLFAKPQAVANATVDYTVSSTYMTALANISAAEISNFRHLQNLDKDTSNVNADAGNVTTAKIVPPAGAASTWTLNWTAWSGSIYKYNSTTNSANFNGIYNPYLTEFSGNNKTISNLVIGNTYGTGIGNAGLFREVAGTQTLTIKNLYLDSPTITAQSGDAGAFVAVNNGALTLKNVLVQGDNTHKISATVNAGGLVGSSAGTSLTVTNSASSMLLNGAKAGGLLGYQSAGSVAISKSYVGGHVNNKKYYVGTSNSASGADRWNIVASGAAGGLIGRTDSVCTTAISETFNAASVFSSAAGSAGGLIGIAGGSFSGVSNVYVVAPVNQVKSITETPASGETPASYTPGTGGSGSALGQLSAVSALPGAGSVFYLLDAYTTPYPVQYTDDYSSIMPVGSLSTTMTSTDLEAIVSAIKPASYYAVETGDSIIGMSSISTLVVKTAPYSASNIPTGQQYPFKIWTRFAFEYSSANDDTFTGDVIPENYPLYYYGDWQPNPNETMVVLDLHFVAVIPDNETTTGTDEYQVLQVQHKDLDTVRVQIPYKPAELALGWPEEVQGYSLGTSWYLYIGDWYLASKQSGWSANKINDMADNAYRSSDYYFETYNVGENVILPASDFQKLNVEANYRKNTDGTLYTDSDGLHHIDITCVSNYTEQDYALVTLSFYDKTVDADGAPTTTNDAYPCGSVMLRVRRADLAAAATLEDLFNAEDGDGNLLNADLQIPSRYLDGYRFKGWYGTMDKYTGTGSDYGVVYENTFNETTQTFAFGDPTNANLISNPGEGKEIKLYAEYEKIETRTLTIHFVDEKGAQLGDDNYKVADYVIPFEADRGFQKELTLPTWGTYVPDRITAGDTNNVEMKDGKPKGFNETPPKITFKIAKMANSAVTDENRNLIYTIKYKKGAQSGYVVLFQLLNTGVTDGSYAYASGSVVYSGERTFEDIQGNTNLYGVTNPGEAPSLNLGDDTLRQNLLSYITSKVGAGFEFTTYTSGTKSEPYRLIKLDGSAPTGFSDSNGNYYPASVMVDGVSSDVQYLIVLQCARVKYELSYNSDEGTDIETELVEFGKPLSFLTLENVNAETNTPHKPERVGYDFKGWALDGKLIANADAEQDIEEYLPTMPASNKTVVAQWEGTPVGFTVAFWYENAKDTDNTDYSYVGKRVYTAAEGKTAGTTLTSKDYKDAFDGVHSYRIDPDTGNEVLVSLDSNHFAYYSGKQHSVKLKADGTSVLNVYFNRKDVYIAFHVSYKTHTRAQLNETKYDYYYVGTSNIYPLVKELDNTPYSKTEHTYQSTTSNDGTQFGLVNGEYWQLRREDASTYTWSPDWEYYNAPDNARDNVFGLVGETYKEYEQLTYVDNNDPTDPGYYCESGTQYTQTTENEQSNTEYYGIYDNAFVRIYYKGNNGGGIGKGWYRQRGGPGSTWSGAYNGTRFKATATVTVNSAYTDTNNIYFIKNNALTNINGQTVPSDATLYGKQGSNTYFPLKYVDGSSAVTATNWVYNSWTQYNGTEEGYYYSYNGWSRVYEYRWLYRWNGNWYSDSDHRWFYNAKQNPIYEAAYYDNDAQRYLRRGDDTVFDDDNTTRYSQSGSNGAHTYTPVDADYHNGEQYYKDANGGYVHLTRTYNEKYNWYWNNGTDDVLYTGTTRYTEGDGVRYNGQHYTRDGDAAPYAYTPVSSENWTGASDHYAADGNIEDTEGCPENQHGHVKLNYVEPSDEWVWVYYDEAGGRHIYEGDSFAYFTDEYDATTNKTMTWTGKWESPFENSHYSWALVDAYQWKETGGSTTQTYMDAFINDEYIDNDSDYTYDLSYNGGKGNHEIRHYLMDKDGAFHDDPAYYVSAYTDSSSGTFNFTNKFPYFTVSGYTESEYHSGYGYGYYTDPEFSATGGHECSPGGKVENTHYPLYVYHTRNAYNIIFMNGTSVVKTVQNVKYEKPFDEIADLIPADPTTRPAGLDASYKFRGWCVDATMTGKTIWFGNDKSGAFVESTMETMTMPGGNLVLYAKWTRDPVDVTFSLAGQLLQTKQVAEDGTVTTTLSALTLPENVTLTWNDSTTADKNFRKLEYGSTLEEEIVDAATGQLKNSYKPKPISGYTFLYWATSDGKRFYNTQALTQSYTRTYDENDVLVSDNALYPVFEAVENNTLEVDVYYVLGEETGYSQTETVTIGNTPMITLQHPPTTGVENYTLDPPYYFETINDAWMTSHYNSTTGRYELTFTYVDATTKWDYAVEYCLLLTPVNGGAKVPVKILTENGHSDAEYIFKAFYSLPGGMQGGYQFTELELVGGTRNGEKSTDPAILLKKGDATTIRVYVEPIINASLTDAIVRVYNGQSQELTAADIQSIKNKLPKISTDIAQTTATLAPENVKYEVTPTYYFGNTKITGSEVKNAGVYRLDIEVKLICTVDSKEYIFWQTDKYTSGSRPGIIFTINRRKVTVASNSVTNIFYDNGKEGNGQYFDDAGNPKESESWLPYGAKLDTLAKDTSTPTIEVERVEANDPNGDATYNAIRSLVIGSSGSGLQANFSADAFRRAPSADKDAFTSNVFTCTLKGLDPNNFDIYMVYGKLYLWESKEAYESYTNPTP